MSLSRSERFRRLPRGMVIRWLIVVAGALLFAIVSFVLYVRSADSDHRRGELHAYRIAMQEGAISGINGGYRHTWENTVWVVLGVDEEGDDAAVWIRDDELLMKLKIAENMSEERMREQFAAAHGGDEPIRMLPGWFEDQPIWEVRYWSDYGGRRHQAIDLYAYTDGTKLKTYELPVQ